MLPLLPFDAHNHVHMGPTWPLSKDTRLLEADADSAWRLHQHQAWRSSSSSASAADLLGDGCLSGMAVMSTHPRDFPLVLDLAQCCSDPRKLLIPCIGVHPWFLHALDKEDWQLLDYHNRLPKWIFTMEDLLIQYPQMPVGEIGLDGFHFDPITKNLTSPMENQIQAFELQLNLAIRHERPVSIHCVRAMSPVMNAISKVQKANDGKLPPTMYFHAFGGKLGTATQLVKTLEKKKATRLFFGFAPVINFESSKTFKVIQEVGIERLVLETDHEDAAFVATSMQHGVQVISKVFGVTPEELIRQTNQNVQELYRLGQDQNL